MPPAPSALHPRPAERRRDARRAAVRPIKVRVDGGGKYYAGQTADISSNGALLELAVPTALRPGQIIRVGISWTSHDVVLAGRSMIEATVVRSLGMNGLQRVAVTFAQRQELAASA
ncbi:MAG: PilZ domain-containing protein [Planctomycetota bacterium]|nr:PilZ domain-containing protein [Planctomycetota bacterium]